MKNQVEDALPLGAIVTTGFLSFLFFFFFFFLCNYWFVVIAENTQNSSSFIIILFSYKHQIGTQKRSEDHSCWLILGNKRI